MFQWSSKIIPGLQSLERSLKLTRMAIDTLLALTGGKDSRLWIQQLPKSCITYYAGCYFKASTGNEVIFEERLQRYQQTIIFDL